ncbi:MAG: hypothetical protein WDZ80_03435 [Candidatus Paceibacterota bacterium]
MKTLLLFILIFVNSFNSLASIDGLKTFVPENGNYKSVEIDIEPKSIINIIKFLGYNSDQFYTYFDTNKMNSKIVTIVFKAFTDEVICVLTDDTVESLSKREVNNYLSDFNLEDEFDSYTIENTLNNGIKNQSLSKKFISEIFGLPVTNNSLVVGQIGYELHFNDSVLVDYNSSDGLNKWAKMWKNEHPSTYRDYKKAASKYWNNESRIINEINIQAEAFANVPGGNQNEYIPLHRSPDGTINFKMLMVAHYNQKITLDEFKLINRGRYELANEFNDNDNYKRTTYRLNKTLYTFDEKGNLVNTYTSE